MLWLMLSGVALAQAPSLPCEILFTPSGAETPSKRRVLTYDAAGNKTSEIISALPSGEKKSTEAWSWKGDQLQEYRYTDIPFGPGGRRSGADVVERTEAGTRTTTRDAEGALKRGRLEVYDGETLIQVDRTDNKEALTQRDHYQYDAQNRVVGAQFDGSPMIAPDGVADWVVVVAYEGAQVTATCAPGPDAPVLATSQHTLDAEGRPVQSKHERCGSSQFPISVPKMFGMAWQPVSSMATEIVVERDDAGRVLKKTEARFGRESSWIHTYDDQGRLLTTRASLSGRAPSVSSYRYTCGG